MSSPWFYFFSFLLVIDACISSAFSSSSKNSLSYHDQCFSIVPKSALTYRSAQVSLPYFSTSFLIGGDLFFAKNQSNQSQFYSYGGKHLKFPIKPLYYETQDKGVYRVDASLSIQSPYWYNKYTYTNSSHSGSYYHHRKTRWAASVRASLSGFWSENSRKLCMIGSATWEYDYGQARDLNVVLQLNYASESPTMYTSITSGTFVSITTYDEINYFDHISIFNVPYLSNYNYSLVSKELDGGLSGDSKVPKNRSLGLQPSRFCAMLFRGPSSFELEYATECNTDQHCSPLGGGDNFLPPFVSLHQIQCSRAKRKVRYMVAFRNTSHATFDQNFGFNSTLIGEAAWDDSNSQLIIVACRILDPADHFGNAVGDCAIRLTLRYPSVWSIRNDATTVGQLWTNKTAGDSGYFRKIGLTSSNDDRVVASQGLKYEYTELDKVRTLCAAKKLVKKKGDRYPDGHSYEMGFHASVKNSNGEKVAWGAVSPLSVGNDTVYDRVVVGTSETDNGTKAPVNISYQISISPLPEVKDSKWFHFFSRQKNPQDQMKITAEGVYDAETGHLCMVGCRKLPSYLRKSTNVSRDCEILVNFQFASLNDRKGGFIKGTIGSTRAKADTLYFDELSLSSAAFSNTAAKQSIWRMDLEITMVFISNTLICIFVGLQIFHLKRNPEVSSSISLVMLLILCLGHLIPLILNFEAMFSVNRNEPRLWLTRGGSWLEVNEVAIRVVIMVAFLFQIRLLQLVWMKKVSEGNDKNWWLGEIKTFFISVPIYILFGMLALFLNQTRHSHGHQAVDRFGGHQIYSLWGNLRSYAGFILDGFLLPQVLLNAIQCSSEKMLSGAFYIGISVVRLVPHAYDYYRAHNYPTFPVTPVTYFYANPRADFYSTAWDIIIPCGVVALAVIIFLQQRYGGRCILPRRFRELKHYEKVPVVSNE